MVARYPVQIFAEVGVKINAPGTPLIVSFFVAPALPHGAFPVAVSVNVTCPAVISASLGVYVAVVSELAFAKVPVPLEVHTTPLWLVADEPVVMLIGACVRTS